MATDAYNTWTPGGPGNWRFGGNFGGRDQSYWEAHPDELMNHVLNQAAPNMSLAYKDWLRDQTNTQSSLWNAYSQIYNDPARATPGWSARPLGDWLASFITGKAPSWGGGVAPKGNEGATIMGDPGNSQRNFMGNLAQELMGSGSRAQAWRTSANSANNPYSALDVMLKASGYAPAVAADMTSRARDLRSEYGGIGEGAPASYAEWLYQRMLRR